VILTTRACGGISIILLIAVLVFTILLVWQQRRSEISDDHWLYARTLLLLLIGECIFYKNLVYKNTLAMTYSKWYLNLLLYLT